MKNKLSLALVVVGLVGWWVFYAPADASGCSKNLDEIIVHCEMYATDHNGHYPESLEGAGRWICPNAGFDTYTSTYSLDPKTRAFSFRCSDSHWQSLGFRDGYPVYDAAGAWCVSPGNYTTLRPDKYVDLFDNPKL